jgi:hypothetical protein
LALLALLARQNPNPRAEGSITIHSL